MPIRSFVIPVVSIILLLQTVLLADDPAAIPAPTIDPLPAGWKHDGDTAKRHKGKYEELDFFFDVIAEQKSITFDKWCKKAEKREQTNSPIYQAKDTPLQAEKIGNYDVMMYEETGTLFLAPVHARVYLIELPESFAVLTCSGGEEAWTKVAGTLDDLVKNMK